MGDTTRGVPKTTAPIVTVTVNQTIVDVEVSSPVTVDRFEGDVGQLADLIAEREADVLDRAVRDAIESLQTEAG